MRRKVIIVALLFATSQAGYSQRVIYKINALSPVLGTLSLMREMAVKESNSLQLGFQYTNLDMGSGRYRGVGFTTEYRLYLSEAPGIRGPYIGPYMRYQELRTVDDPGLSVAESTYKSLGVGVIYGKQWVFKERFVLDLFIGPGYNFKLVEKQPSGYTKSGPRFMDGYILRAGMSFGIAKRQKASV